MVKKNEEGVEGVSTYPQPLDPPHVVAVFDIWFGILQVRASALRVILVLCTFFWRFRHSAGSNQFLEDFRETQRRGAAYRYPEVLLSLLKEMEKKKVISGF